MLKNNHVSAVILHLDDFMHTGEVEESLPIQPRLDYKLAHAKIKEVLSGNACISKPKWSDDASYKFEETVSLVGINLLIFEGEYTLSDSAMYDFLKYSSLRIYMQAHDKDMLEWNWQRGRAIQQQTKDDFFAYMTESMHHYHTYIEPTQKHAHYIVFHNMQHQYMLRSSVD